MTDLKKNIFCMALLSQLLIRGYGLPGVGGTLADVLLIFTVAWVIINQKSKLYDKDTVLCFLPFGAFVFFSIFLTWHSDISASDQIIDWLRSVLYYYIIIFGVKKYFDIQRAYKIYEVLAIASTFFLFIQYVSVVFGGKYISGFFGALSLVDSSEMYNNFSFYSISTYRPNSFFPEPAHYATFVIGYLCLNCLKKVNLKSIIITVSITSGVLLSGSTTGLVMCGLIIFFWLFNFFKEIKNLKYFILIMILVFIAIQFLLQMDSFQFMLYRTFESDHVLRSRLQWFSADVFVLETVLDYLFGVGNCSAIIQNGVGWLPGWALIFQNYGILGTGIYIVCGLRLFLKCSKQSKVLFIVFWVLGIGAEVLVDQHMLIYWSFIIAGIDKLIPDNNALVVADCDYKVN